MDDVFSAMLVVAISAVLLVAGQQYLYKKPEISAATLNVAVDTLSSYVR
jgi:outer membrane murein-binding lipoprotein Lpp